MKRFSVSEEKCISCAACWKLATDHFDSHPVTAKAIVYHQPKSELEVRKCEEAEALCPVQAIEGILADLEPVLVGGTQLLRFVQS